MAHWFVSRWTFETALARADAAHQRAQDEKARAAEFARLLDAATHENARLSERYDALVHEVIQMKRVGFGAFEQDVPDSPLQELGASTRAALVIMGQGQSGAVRRAMTSRAIALSLELKRSIPDVSARDLRVADAVRRGELAAAA